MKKTLSEHEIINSLLDDQNAGWSIQGATALTNCLLNYEYETGEELELDVVAIRCDFNEWKNIDEFLDNHKDLDIRNEEGEIDEVDLKKEIEDKTNLILLDEEKGLDNGFITQSF